MKLYYFSGTGNSLDIAKQLSKKLKADLIPLATVKGDVKGESIGIVFPIYMFNAPLMVYEFLSRIKSCKYLYIVMTMGGNSGKTTDRVKKIVEKNGVSLSAGFSIQMPDNYLAWNEAMPEGKQVRLFSKAKSRIDEMASIVKGKKNHFDTEDFPKSDELPFPISILPKWTFQAMCDLGHKRIPKMDSSFIVTDKCIGCQTCGKLCPSKNITFKDKRPVWNSDCEQCFGCIQWCPKEAIEFGKNTVGRKRYHNPNVKVTEMFLP